MIKAQTNNLNFLKNHIVKRFSEILETKGLELYLTKNKIIGHFWFSNLNYGNTFIYVIPKNIKLHFLLTKNNKNKGLTFSYKNVNYQIVFTELKHLYNLILGILTPYKKTIEIHGTGFKFNIIESFPFKNNIIEISAGFSMKKYILIPSDIYVNVIDSNTITLFSCYKNKLTLFCDNIKRIKSINKYKLRGIKYSNEKFIPKTYKKTK